MGDRILAIVVALVCAAGCADVADLLDAGCPWQVGWEHHYADDVCLLGEADPNTRLRLVGDTCAGWERRLLVRPGDVVQAGVRPGERVKVGSITWESVLCAE